MTSSRPVDRAAGDPAAGASPTGDRALPLIQYWHDEDVPEEVDVLLSRARDRNPDLSHMLFDREAAAALIEAHFTPREVAAFQTCTPPAMQADYFRYCAVHALGGVYLDADLHCVEPLDGLLVRAGTLCERFDARVVTNSLFGFGSPGHPLLELAIEIATRGIESRLSESVVVVTGPAIFTGLTMVWRFGVEASIELLREWETIPIDRQSFVRQLRAIAAVVGDHREIAGAFAGVRLLPRAELATLVAHPAGRLRYRRTGNHYLRWPGSIYG